jgi:hypothetical protein
VESGGVGHGVDENVVASAGGKGAGIAASVVVRLVSGFGYGPLEVGFFTHMGMRAENWVVARHRT